MERAALPLAPEAVVELRDPKGVVVRWFCTPERLDELAAGWLVGEGRARSPADIGPIRVEGAEAVARLEAPAADPRTAAPPPAAGPRRAPDAVEALTGRPSVLHDLFRDMFELGVLRERSGGVHTGALVRERELVAVREDVSRHCVVDKLVGHAVLSGIPLAGTALLLSGRVSAAIATKAACAGIAVVATMSIPTTLAAEIAGAAGVTLIGRARSAAPLVYAPKG